MALSIFVTGIAGFVGSHFTEYALRHGAKVFGACFPGAGADNIAHLRDDVSLTAVDLREAPAVRAVLDRVAPDWIVHLAAQSFVGTSWEAPQETLVNNVLAQLNVLEAVRQGGGRPRILVVGSSDQYGDVGDSGAPIAETAPFRPLSPYAVSKVTQDMMGYQYWRSYGLSVIRARAFNHEGPRRGEAFLTSSLARQIAEIEQGLRERAIRVGNLTPRRDYTDVRDIVRGYWLLLKDGEAGDVYNLCSGRAWSVQAILDFLVSHARVRPIDVHVDSMLLRPTDVPVVVGDPSKIREAVGWRAEIPFEQTLRDVLGYWRSHVESQRRA